MFLFHLRNEIRENRSKSILWLNLRNKSISRSFKDLSSSDPMQRKCSYQQVKNSLDLKTQCTQLLLLSLNVLESFHTISARSLNWLNSQSLKVQRLAFCSSLLVLPDKLFKECRLWLKVVLSDQICKKKLFYRTDSGLFYLSTETITRSVSLKLLVIAFS